jgi:transposase, IS5 family
MDESATAACPDCQARSSPGSKAGNGRQPMSLERMLRVYFMEQWFNLSDPQAEDALYDIEPMRRFVGVELAEDTIPDETTILRFRHLLETHKLTAPTFAEVRGLLEEKELLLKSETVVDATIIGAPSSTKNEAQAHDTEMHQTKKNKQWYFGMKVHVSTDQQTRRVGSKSAGGRVVQRQPEGCVDGSH